MDYIGLIKKSLGIVWKNKFLWFLGILAGGSAGGFNFTGWSGGGEDWENLFQNETLPDKIRTSLSSGIIKGQTAASDLTNINQWAANNWIWIVIAILVVLLLAIIFMVISYCCQGGLIEAVDELEKGNKSSFGKAFVAGWHRFWSLLGATLLVCLIMLIILSYLIISGILLFSFGSKIFSIFWLAGMISLLIVIAVYVQFLINLAFRAIMIGGVGAIEGLKMAHNLIFKKFGEIVLSWLTTLVLGIIFGLALAIAIVAVGMLLLGMGFAVYFAGKMTATIIYAIIFGLAFFVAFMLVSGFIKAVFSTFWTLVYREIK